MIATTFVNPQNLGPMVVNLLAVAGGFLLGAVLAQLIVTMGLKYITVGRIKAPGWVLWGVRLLGGVTAAWLVALFVFGSSGTGWWPGFGGGPGGLGTGKEGGPGTQPGPDPGPKKNGGPVGGGKEEDSLRVEVLNWADGQQIMDSRRYRFAADAALKTLDEVKEAVERRLQEAGVKRLGRVEIVIYLNSPDRDTPTVKDLVNWVTLKGLEPAVTMPPVKSP